MASPDDKNVFVTVGTTQFDALIQAVIEPNLLEILSDLGYSTLNLQIGHGTVKPSSEFFGRMKVKYFTFKEDIVNEIREAHLVVSHAGAGSCFEILKHKKPLVVVVNNSLMDNHQLELAHKLANDNYAYMCEPETLKQTLINMDLNTLKPLPAANTAALLNFLNLVMKVQNK